MDAELILKAKSGNRDAFSTLVKSYSKRVYYAAFIFLHNVEDASDIVQEVFLRAYKHLEAFDCSRPLYPWLYRITKNLCLNRLKSRGRSQASLPENLVSSGSTPESELFREEEAEKIRRALSRLSENQREIISLKHFENCSYAEIAEILSIPAGTVMSRLYNARLKLKEELVQEDM
ncbi:MAG: RNA polymerase sigma factor [Spirochaetota bacterium]